MTHPNTGILGPQAAAAARLEEDVRSELHTRRDVVRCGVKLAFVVPIISTFLAKDAYAAASRFSCYPDGHACPGAEPCCDGLSCTGGTCNSNPCMPDGGLCFIDSDCCSNKCRKGLCHN